MCHTPELTHSWVLVCFTGSFSCEGTENVIRFSVWNIITLIQSDEDNRCELTVLSVLTSYSNVLHCISCNLQQQWWFLAPSLWQVVQKDEKCCHLCRKGKISFKQPPRVLMLPYYICITCSLSASPQFSGLYLVSLVVILIGFIAFNSVPTPTQRTEHPTSSSSSICEEGYDNPVATHDDAASQHVAVRISTEMEEDEQQRGGEKEDGWEEEEKRKRNRALGLSHSVRGGDEDEDVVGGSTKMWTRCHLYF